MKKFKILVQTEFTLSAIDSSYALEQAMNKIADDVATIEIDGVFTFDVEEVKPKKIKSNG